MSAATRKNIQSKLTDFQKSSPGCLVAMVFDPTTAVVLCSNDAPDLSQDALERLAANAKKTLRTPIVTSLESFSSDGEFVAVTFTGDSKTSVAVQKSDSKDDAIVCAFASSPDREGVIALVHDVFGQEEAAA